MQPNLPERSRASSAGESELVDIRITISRTHRTLSPLSWHDLCLFEVEEDAQRAAAEEQAASIEQESIPRLGNDLAWQLGQRRHFGRLIGEDMRGECGAELM